MENTVVVALISSGSSVLVAMTALILNYRGFASIESRFASLDGRMAAFENRMTAFENRMDARLNLMQSTISSLLTDVALLKDKAGL